MTRRIRSLAPTPTFAEPPVRHALDRLMHRRDIAGLQYLLTLDGEPRIEVNAGLADGLRDTEVTAGTTFNLYSITKPFTAACVIAAADAGALDLDAPIATATGLDGLGAFGSVRETLLHRAGFPNPMPLRWFHLAEEDAGFDEAGFVTRQLQALQGRRVRRGRAAYSNLGYLALGRAIERVHRTGFRQALQESLLSRLPPFDGGRLGFTATNPADHARGQLRRHGWLALALGWLVDRDRIVEAATPRMWQLRLHHVDGSAYGGLMGNARGLAAFGQSVLARALEASGPARAGLLDPVPGPGAERTLAWFAGRLQGQRWLAHAGGGLGGYGELRLYPTLGAVSVLLTNTPGLRDHGWLDDIDRHWLPAG